MRSRAGDWWVRWVAGSWVVVSVGGGNVKCRERVRLYRRGGGRMDKKRNQYQSVGQLVSKTPLLVCFSCLNRVCKSLIACKVCKNPLRGSGFSIVTPPFHSHYTFYSPRFSMLTTGLKSPSPAVQPTTRTFIIRSEFTLQSGWSDIDILLSIIGCFLHRFKPSSTGVMRKPQQTNAEESLPFALATALAC